VTQAVRVPTLQVWSHEFKPQWQKKKQGNTEVQKTS
jgi:hypothetical protein